MTDRTPKTKRPGEVAASTGSASPENLPTENGMTSEPSITRPLPRPDVIAALSELEDSVNKAKDRANVLWSFAELTVCEDRYQMGDQHQNDFVVLIGDVLDACNKIHRHWNAEWEKYSTGRAA